VLGGNRFHLGVIEGAADSVSSLLKLWAGGRSDVAGRRKAFVVAGYALAACTRPVLAVVTAPWQLFLVRFGDRIGKGIRTSPRDALIADTTSPDMRGRAFGFHRAMDHLGAALGPLLAAAYLAWRPGDVRTLFVLALVPGLTIVALLGYGLREPAAVGPSREPLHFSLRPFDRNFRRLLIALFVFTLGNSSDAFLLVRAEELGVPPVQLPLLWCAFHVLKSAGNLWLGRGVDRWGPRPFLFVGWSLYACIYLGFGYATAAWHAWGLFLAYAIFYGAAEPAEKTLVGRLADPAQKGLAYGWYNCAVGLATLPASLVFGAIYQELGAVIAFGWGACLASAAIALLCGVSDRSSPAS
jgi:MFS family permease